MIDANKWLIGPLNKKEQRRSSEAVAFAKARFGKWFHGGTAGLAIGTKLLPASQTGLNPRGFQLESVNREEHVFFSQSSKLARYYADMVPGGGAVYQVKPLGKIEADPEVLRIMRRFYGAYIPAKINQFRAPAAVVVLGVPDA